MKHIIKNISNKLNRNEIKLTLQITLVIAFMCCILFSKYIWGGVDFLFDGVGSDTIRVNYPAYYNYFLMLEQGDFSLWSMNMGIGTSILSHADIIFDPFNYILYIFGKAHIADMVIYMVIAKIICSGLAFNVYLSNWKVSNFSRIIACLAYAFSGYIMIMGLNFVFSTVCVYFPLALSGIEKLLKVNKYRGLFISLFLIAIYFYYFYYIVGIGLFIYLTMRYYGEFNQGIKTYFKYIIKLLILGILPILLGAVIIFPCLQLVLNSARTSGPAVDIISLITPNFDALKTGIGRLFYTNLPGTQFEYSGDYFELALFTGMLTILLLPQAIYYSKSKKKSFVYIGIGGIALLFPVIAYLFNYFSAYTFRWSFIINALLALTLALSMDALITKRKFNLKLYVITVIVSCIMMLLLRVYFLEKQLPMEQITITEIGETIKYPLIIIFFNSVFICGYKFFKNIKLHQICNMGLVAILFLDIFFNYNSWINKNEPAYSDAYDWNIGYHDDSNQIIKRIKEEDKGIYRLEKNYESCLVSNNTFGSDNDAMVQDYYGLKSYNSLNQPNYIQFLRTLGIYVKFPPQPIAEGNTPFDFNGQSLNYINGVDNRYKIMSYLGMKYYITDNNIVEDIPEYFEKYFTINNKTVYKNKGAFPLAFVQNKVYPYDDFIQLTDEEKDDVLLQNVVLDDATISKYSLENNLYNSKSTQKIINKEIEEIAENYEKDIVLENFAEDHMSFKVSVKDEKSILAFSIPYEKYNWNIYVDGKKAEALEVNIGMLGTYITQGDHLVEIRYIPLGLKLGMLVSLVTLIFIVIYIIKEKRKNNGESKKI